VPISAAYPKRIITNAKHVFKNILAFEFLAFCSVSNTSNHAPCKSEKQMLEVERDPRAHREFFSTSNAHQLAAWRRFWRNRPTPTSKKKDDPRIVFLRVYADI
jgi:hypothetical protein